MHRLRLFTFRLFALLAALGLLTAQVSAIEHAWSHILDPQGKHAVIDPDRCQIDDPSHAHEPHDDGMAVALCDLCAHYAAVVHVPPAPSGATFLSADAGFAQPLVHVSPLPARGAVHYAARAPPVSLI